MSDASAALELGVKTMDDEHRLQLALVGELAGALREGREVAATQEILERLQAYTEAHFLAEQLMMRLQGYPLYQGHVQEHDRLLAELTAIGRTLADGGNALPTAEHLEGWLTRHIMGMDRTYAEFTAQPGVTPAPHAS
jgi:hemerythrin